MLKNKKRGGISGFTLIELLVVIAIIGILSSIILASLNSARKKGRDARRVADIKQIQLALEMYFDTHGEYPAGTSVSDLSVLESDNYIASIPKDPLSAWHYYYQSTDGTSACTSACTSYHLGARLEEPGTGADGTGGNAALSSDVDNSIGFPGLSTDCATAGSDDGCYDVTP